MADYEVQKIELTGVPNARQLGGYIGHGGKKVKNNVLLRTGSLTGANENTIKQLETYYNLGSLIDLRMRPEREVQPDPVISGAEYYPLSVLDSLVVDEKDLEAYLKAFALADLGQRYKLLFESKIKIDTADIYSQIAFSESGIAGYTRMFEILLDNPENSAVLFHCTQGKDRTGIAAALILSALGVDRQTIIEDYLLTNVAYADTIEALREEVMRIKPEMLEFALFVESVNAAFIQPVFDTMDKEYGSALGFIQNALKVSDKGIEVLRRLYLE